jgi:class 3 adenylate cyclase/HAMP domain-containing protein
MVLLKWIFKDRSLEFKFTLLAVIPVIVVTLFIVQSSINALERRMIEKTIAQARGLTRLFSLSLANASVIYNKGLLDNFVDNLQVEEIIISAMIVDANSNRILSHSNHSYDGKIYKASEHSYGPTLPRTATRALAEIKEGDTYELSRPIVIKGIEYGHVKLGFSIKKTRLQIAQMKNRVILIAVLAIALGIFSSIFMGRILGKPIKTLALKAEKIGEGDFEQRMDYESKDALGHLAESFNKMTGALSQNLHMLEENEKKYRALFEYSPLSLWQEDFSEAKTYLGNLIEGGVQDLREYFHDHPEEVTKCLSMIKVLDVNQTTLQMFEAESKEELLLGLDKIIPESSWETLIEELIAIAKGRPFEMELTNMTLSGKEITVLMKTNIPPGYEQTWSKVFVSIQDQTERAKSEFLKKMFGRYLSEEVLTSLIDNPDSIKLGGEKRDVTIMMTDLRGFTAVSERLDPEQVVQMLNDFFEVMVDVILKYNGTINEIIGDALLVIFGAPQQMEDRSERGVACAIEMQNAMVEVNRQNRQKGLPALEMGIGLNEAEVIVGNVGSRKRSKYGVVGSGVNMTSRIESFTVGGQILISDSVRKKTGDILRINDQLEIRPKGAKHPLTLHDIGGIAGRYNVFLEDMTQTLLDLTQEIPVHYTALDGKYMDEGKISGAILRLSRKSGNFRLQTKLNLLTNLKFNLENVTEELAHQDFYGKVVATSEKDPDIYTVTFTSMPPGIDGYIQAVISHGAREVLSG